MSKEENMDDPEHIFNFIDKSEDKTITRLEWSLAFDKLDIDHNNSISRKEWYLKNGCADLFDAICKRHKAAISRQEWQRAFEELDVDGGGSISLSEWKQLAHYSFKAPKKIQKQ